MSDKMTCRDLTDFKKRIASGENPDDVIPYCVNIKSPEEAIEFLFYAKQVLKDPHRIKLCEDILERMNTYESR